MKDSKQLEEENLYYANMTFEIPKWQLELWAKLTLEMLEQVDEE